MPAAERSRTSAAEALVAMVAGLALLAIRPVVAGSFGGPLLVVAILTVLAATSLSAPIAQTTPLGASLGPTVVLAIGIGAFVAAAFLPGARVPLPTTSAAVLANSLAAVAEEAFFRRLVYGRLASIGPAAAIAGSALLFALVHVPIYGVAVFWVDLGAGLLFGWQRWASGRWDLPAATHVAANLLAVMR
jgi:membrane protease YdiL (CAAX protease family)